MDPLLSKMMEPPSLFTVAAGVLPFPAFPPLLPLPQPASRRPSAPTDATTDNPLFQFGSDTSHFPLSIISVFKPTSVYKPLKNISTYILKTHNNSIKQSVSDFSYILKIK